MIADGMGIANYFLDVCDKLMAERWAKTVRHFVSEFSIFFVL